MKTKLRDQKSEVRGYWHWPTGLLLVTLLLALPASAADFTLDWWTLDGGGGVSTGGGYAVSGTVGQPDAGRMSGGNYVLEGGFWGVFAVIPPALSIARAGASVIVSWPLSASGWVLEATSTLTSDPVPWIEVSPPYASSATQYYLDVSPPSGTKFYRLRKEP